MSGGHFGYAQYKIEQISDQIAEIIRRNDTSEFPFSPAVIQKMTEALRQLGISFVYAQRIDFLVSGDDDEETFEKRLKEDLEILEDEGKT
jgi:hypothetical protein